jgi:hypothetical protein
MCEPALGVQQKQYLKKAHFSIFLIGAVNTTVLSRARG